MFKEKKEAAASAPENSEAAAEQAESRETVRRSIKERLAHFFGQDREIEELAARTDLQNPAKLAEIKEEIQLEPSLAEINAEAKDLEAETLASLSEKGQENKSEEENFYNQEILPLLKVLAPEDGDFAQYEASILSELRQTAETLQNREGRAAASSERENLQEMKSILLARCHQTIVEQTKLIRLSERKDQVFNADLIKQAKIALLAGGDFSDINRGRRKWDQYGSEKMPSPSTLFNYFRVKAKCYSVSALSAPEMSALMKAGMTPQFLAMDFDDQKQHFKVFTDEYLRLFNEKEEGYSNRVEYILENHPDPEGYSREIFQQLLDCDKAHVLRKFLKQFEQSITPDDVKDLILKYNPGYPYHAGDLNESVNSLAWSEEEKGKLVDFIVLHNYVDTINVGDRSNFLATLSAEQRAKYEPICEDITNLITIPGDWKRFKPENLPKEKMDQLRQHVENGRLSFIRLEGYLGYFLDNDYDWVLSQAKRFGQEELLLQFPDKFHPEDQQRLAEKFLAEGKADVLDTILSDRKACFAKDCLSLNVYKQLMAQGYYPPFHSFSQLDEEVAANALKKGPYNLFNGEAWYYNAHKVSLNREELAQQKQYQEIVVFVRSYFPDASGKVLYDELKLNAGFVKGIDPETFKNKIKANTEVFRQYYLKLLKEDEILSDKDLSWAIDAFCKNTGYDLYLSDSEYLATFLENSRFVPKTLASSREWLRASTEALMTLPKEQRQEESKNFNNIFDKDLGNASKKDQAEASFDSFKFLNLRHSFKGESIDFFQDFFKKVGAPRSLLIKTASLWTEKALSSPADNEHWAEKFLAYVSATENTVSFPEAEKKNLDDLFSGPYRDQCLRAFQDEWTSFLNSEEKQLPFPLKVVAGTVEEAGGAGNLKHFEALSGLVGRVGEACDNKRTVARTKKEIKDILSKQELRFEKDKWSQSDRSNFYNLADDLIAAAPSIFASFAPIFENLSGKEMKAFSKELLPLYQAQLIVLQDTDQNGEPVYKVENLFPFKKKLEFLAASMKLYPEDKEETLAEEKERLIKDVSGGFKERFGLVQFPQELKREDLRTLQNCVRYIGNISHRDAKKESILSLFLALELNKEWADFRSGKDVDFKKHLTADKLKLISDILEAKKKNVLSSEVLGIKESDLPAFQDILQRETKNSMLGSLETIDVKVGKIKNSFSDLTDADTYNDPIDKSLLALQSSAGRQIGSTLAKTYNELEGRPVTFSEGERALQKELAQIFQISSWDQVTVKKIQDRVQPFNLLSNLLKKIGVDKEGNNIEESGSEKAGEDKVDENIKELRRRLLPSAAVSAIFNRLDEAFKPDSGAHASFKDLEYLESQVIKEESQLKPEEKKLIQDYLQGIKEKMLDLEKIASTMEEYFDKIKNSFDNLEKTEPARRTSPLAKCLQEMEKIVHSTGEGMIVSRVTNDLNFIIENMRMCLGCLRKEANNDTNLAFGDFNKFFMMSEQEKRSGSVADEIVFFAPLEIKPGEKEMSFVMDQVYGNKSADILLAHTLALHKKYLALKDKFPEAKLSLAVTDAALSTAGIDANLLTKKMQEKLGDGVSFEVLSGAKVDIPASSLSDNYVEFGGVGARTSGERAFNGLIVR